MHNSNSIRKIALLENLGYATTADTVDINISAAAQYFNLLTGVTTFNAVCKNATYEILPPTVP